MSGVEMAMTTITVRVDEQTKQNAGLVLADIGLDVSTAVRMFLRQLVIRGQMPIELLQDPFYSESNLVRLRESIDQADRGEFTKVTTLEELKAASR